MNFENEDINQVLKKLNTSLNGLSQSEVLKRQTMYGKNELPKKREESIFKIFIRQIIDPIVIILLVTIVISLVTHEYVDAVAIILIVLIDLILGTIQEYSAIKKAHSLENIIKVNCLVLRDNKETIVDARELVVGDIIYLESGNKISADLRVLDSYNLTIDESVLTGESISVYKSSKKMDKKVEGLEKTNILYAGTSVLTGRATCLVIETGVNTELGKIAKSVTDTKEEKSPLTIRIQKFSKQISLIVLLMAVILTILLVLKGNHIEDVFMLVVALSISALPEGLPLALTMALTIASSRMLNRNVIVKKLNSVESLGSCTLIASDKTGTLTVNEQTAKIIMLPNEKQFEISGIGYNLDGHVIINMESDKKDVLELIKLGFINNEAKVKVVDDKVDASGDSIDIAFKILALKEKVKTNYQIIKRIPYESVNKYSAVFYEHLDSTYVTIKGSFEKIIEFCKYMEADKVTNIDFDLLKTQNENLAREGYRVIAIASGKLKAKDDYFESDIKDLTFKGLVGFIDPVRDDCKESISKCLKAGVKVVMITGDHPLTAYKIAKDLGLVKTKDEVTTGAELTKKLNEGKVAFDEYVKNHLVFARVTPLDKLEIVESYKRMGEFVGVTGDGVNDAPALKAANIGIAIGSGTDVSLESANMILVDDKFSSIVRGIEEGRCAYSNIRKVTYMLISCGLAEVLFFFLSIFFNLPVPLLAIQLLWLNIVTDGLQDLALSFESTEDNIMNVKPRSPKENLFNKDLIEEVLLSGIIIGLLVFIIWVYLIKVLNFDVSVARGYIMALMVFIQNIHVLNCRSEENSVFSLKKNKFVIFSIVSAIVLQIIVMEVPLLSHMFKTESIPILNLIILFIISLSILLVMELYKMLKYKKNK